MALNAKITMNYLVVPGIEAVDVDPNTWKAIAENFAMALPSLAATLGGFPDRILLDVFYSYNDMAITGPIIRFVIIKNSALAVDINTAMTNLQAAAITPAAMATLEDFCGLTSTIAFSDVTINYCGNSGIHP